MLGTPLTRTRALVAAIPGAGDRAGPARGGDGRWRPRRGPLVGAEFDVVRFLAASVIFWLFGCAIAGVTSFVAALTLSRGVAAGVAAGVLLVMYLLNIVAEMQVDLAWLGDLGWSEVHGS